MCVCVCVCVRSRRSEEEKIEGVRRREMWEVGEGGVISVLRGACRRERGDVHLITHLVKLSI